MPDEPSHEKLEQLRDAIFARRKIEAIKLHREFSGSGLAASKEYIEKLTAELQAKHPEKFASKPKGCSVAAVLFLLAGFILLIFVSKARSEESALRPLPSLDQALDSKTDLWGLAAMCETNGPSYEFFENLLPPLRYVNAAFRHYPIPLSAPNAPVKARLISNGSALNARASLKSWKEPGVPVEFHVGDKGDVFGSDIRQLRGPVYENGYLPIVRMSYTHNGSIYEQESFAGVENGAAEHGLIFVKFTLRKSSAGRISAKIESQSPLVVSNYVVLNTNGKALVWFNEDWTWNAVEQRLTANLSKNQSARLAIATKPMNSTTHISINQAGYESKRKKCVQTWKTLLAGGMRLETPEAIVNNAWRSLIVQNYAMVNGNEPRYSSGNAYDQIYEAESGDVMRAFMLFGFAADTKRMLPALLNYSRDTLDFHNAGFKLQLFAHYYWLTRDTDSLNEMREQWSKEVKRIAETRDKENGLAPRERYCGDIDTKVYSLHASAAGWRGLRDMAAVLDAAGEQLQADKLHAVAKEFRGRIFAAAEKSIFTNTQPPFIPIALFSEEKPHDPLTGTMLGSYWNLMAPYVLGSEVFGHGSQRERWMLDYLQDNGGVFMGLIRFDQHSGLFANENAVDDLYGLRYVTTLLRLDEVDRALVSFYGKLAQGMTRDTFIGAEGTGLKPLDEHGRPMYLPPNSSANAHFLYTLRYMLLQDFDLNDDGKPETLRLLFATPKRWLEDGKEIKLENAPSAFGNVSIQVKSQLSKGDVFVDVKMPSRNAPEKVQLRIRLPDGWKIVAASSGGRKLDADEKGTMDISKMTGDFALRLKVTRN